MISFNIFIGLILGLLFFLVRLPYYIIKRKFFNWQKVLFEIILGVYIVCLIGVTLLPIPFDNSDPLVRMYPEKDNYIPFFSIYTTATQAVSPTIAIKQILGNLVMLMPLGVILPFISKKIKQSVTRAVFIGFLVSLSIELLQTFVSLLINYKYRSFDVDDIILNTLGSFLGTLLFKLIYPYIIEHYQAIHHTGSN